MGAFQDFLPTLGEVSGQPVVDGSDGISLLPELLQEPQQEHPYLYWEFPSYGGQVAVRTGRWKAIRKGLFKDQDAPLELYDLETDIAEEHDVAGQHPEVADQIMQIIRDARTPSPEFPFPALDSLNGGI